jgi:spore photoproduct lyase
VYPDIAMNFSAVYIEEEVFNMPRVEAILARIPAAVPRISCQRYGEIFNRSAQNFRLQKQQPALILACKQGKLVLPAPSGYGYNNAPSFYFSHMLNCVYDCRYCFLQGMYRSANYVLFVNYEAFAASLEQTMQALDQPAVFYSGYDCDSLALEPVSRFTGFFLEFFARHPQASLEIRTKSTQIRALLNHQPLANCIIAMSFTPKEIHSKWEHGVPSIGKRLEALQKLQQLGWSVAIRLEPLIDMPDAERHYQRLLGEIFSRLDAEKIHSVSSGLFRMPRDYFKNTVRLYPDEALFAGNFHQQHGMIAQTEDKEAELLNILERQLFRYLPERLYYRCASDRGSGVE